MITIETPANYRKKGSADGTIREDSSPRKIGPRQVLVHISHSTLCASTGTVSQVGDAVAKSRIGNQCRWDYQDSNCGSPSEQRVLHLPQRDQGSFVTMAVWSEAWPSHLPKGLSNTHAAPLMCAGSTVWTALQKNPVRPTDRVGMVGLGGLGLVAVLSAMALGCEVVVFSKTENKREEAMKPGADEFHAAEDQQILNIGAPLDRLLVAASSQADWELFISLMALEGSIYPITIAFDNLSIPYLEFVLSELKLHRCTVSSCQMHIDMWEFAARKGIKIVG
ncbi:hypothetical protein BCR34DRAFT_621597 [Clohesyomyces aquaticus]|uniref:Alcohol dehydrogenase-like C-terminal domain-containing protein n=1 Tax=Clohesyomyces aquaticus TaxID=1231657 RepID=A0A1Y2A604_9PLEO|nr:hypothetical protein BCR34DRAFT_621597 [Clohesyomyces aquaticus]